MPHCLHCYTVFQKSEVTSYVLLWPKSAFIPHDYLPTLHSCWSGTLHGRIFLKHVARTGELLRFLLYLVDSKSKVIFLCFKFEVSLTYGGGGGGFHMLCDLRTSDFISSVRLQDEVRYQGPLLVTALLFLQSSCESRFAWLGLPTICK